MSTERDRFVDTRAGEWLTESVTAASWRDVGNLLTTMLFIGGIFIGGVHIGIKIGYLLTYHEYFRLDFLYPTGIFGLPALAADQTLEWAVGALFLVVVIEALFVWASLRDT